MTRLEPDRIVQEVLNNYEITLKVRFEEKDKKNSVLGTIDTKL